MSSLIDLAVSGWGAAGPISLIYRNDGGIFSDIGATLTAVSMCSLAWGDYDNDRDPDLVLSGSDASFNVTRRIYRNDAGIFNLETNAVLAGMNRGRIAWGDFDNDGDLDLALVGFGNTTPVSKVYRNDGGGTFADLGVSLAGVDEGFLAWADYDNDGDLDLSLAGFENNIPITKIYRNDIGGGKPSARRSGRTPGRRIRW